MKRTRSVSDFEKWQLGEVPMHVSGNGDENLKEQR